MDLAGLPALSGPTSRGYTQVVQPRVPSDASPLAVLCLEAIAAAGLGSSISIRGAFGLSHYLPYRGTRDLDAWWTDAATPEARGRLIRAVEATLKTAGSPSRPGPGAR